MDRQHQQQLLFQHNLGAIINELNDNARRIAELTQYHGTKMHDITTQLHTYTRRMERMEQALFGSSQTTLHQGHQQTLPTGLPMMGLPYPPRVSLDGTASATPPILAHSLSDSLEPQAHQSHLPIPLTGQPMIHPSVPAPSPTPYTPPMTTRRPFPAAALLTNAVSGGTTLPFQPIPCNRQQPLVPSQIQ